jgi:phosphoglycolate phosphatase
LGFFCYDWCKVKTIIFDFDGTIADSFMLLVGIFEEITKRPAKFTEAEITELRGKQVKQILKYLRIKRWQIPRFLVRGRQAMTAQIETVVPIKGLPEALEQLHRSGYRMIILSSNSGTNISKFLAMNNLGKYFESVHGGVGVFNKAAALRKLIKKEKLELGNCIYIGDEVRDIEAARKVGVKYISVGWGFSTSEALRKENPMKFVTKPSDLPAAIQTL